MSCSGCGHRMISPRAAGWLVLGAVIAGASGVRSAWHAVSAAVEVVTIAALSLAGLGLLGVTAYGAYRVRLAFLAGRPAPYRVEVVTVTPQRPGRPAGRPAAIEAPRPRPAPAPPAEVYSGGGADGDAH